MLYFFLHQFLVYCPLVFAGIILLLILASYLSEFCKKLKIFRKISFKKLIWLLIGATVVFDFGLSLVQYFVWRANSFSRFFLPPYQSWDYFLSYSFFHFFLADILSLFSALFFYVIFKTFKKYKGHFISECELNLLFLASLLIAWPKILFFIPLLLFLGVLFSLFNFLVLKKGNINWPSLIILALLLSFLGAGYFLKLTGLEVLFI